MLVHGLWQVRDVEVGIGLIRESLQLGIERFLRRSVRAHQYQEGEQLTLAKLTS